MKLTTKQIKTILHKVEIAERKMNEAAAYVDKVTQQLQKYGAEGIIAVYHYGDGVMFQSEEDYLFDMTIENLIKKMQEFCTNPLTTKNK